MTYYTEFVVPDKYKEVMNDTLSYTTFKSYVEKGYIEPDATLNDRTGLYTADVFRKIKEIKDRHRKERIERLILARRGLYDKTKNNRKETR